MEAFHQEVVPEVLGYHRQGRQVGNMADKKAGGGNPIPEFDLVSEKNRVWNGVFGEVPRRKTPTVSPRLEPQVQVFASRVLNLSRLFSFWSCIRSAIVIIIEEKAPHPE